MTDQAEILKPFIERREKNLAYFKDHFPGIYKHFLNYQMKKAKLNIIPDAGEVDIHDEGRSVYGGKAKAYALNEIKEFTKVYSEGGKVVSIDPPFPGDYCFPRFFFKTADAIIRKSPINKSNFNHFWLGDSYPCIVFLGCGVGYHIEAFLEQHRVNYAVIFEPNLDHFAASLYAVDWAEICRKYDGAEGRTIHFLLGGQEDEYSQWALLWNNLVTTPPAFPLATLFYNHRGLKSHDNLSEKVCDDLYVFLVSWGNYDDEVNQLNQAAHNIYSGVELLPPPVNDITDVPVCIVGAGPSLDLRIDQLREMQQRGALIISCGSSITALHPMGIKPDIHVELESDYQYVVGQLERLKDPDYLNSIKVIAPIHISPVVYQLFGERRAYIKEECGLATMFSEHGQIIRGGTPTCTNLGLAWALHYGFKNILLFGMDFGFTDRRHHHAQSSIYYDDDAHEAFKRSVDYDGQHVFKVEGVDGGSVLTSPQYFAAKRKAENSLRDFPERGKVYNFSHGAKIEGADWVAPGPLPIALTALSASSDKKQKVVDYLYASQHEKIPVDVLEKKRDRLNVLFGQFSDDVSTFLQAPISSKDDMNRVCNRINTYMEDQVQTKAKEFYFLLRGSIRHFLYIGFAHALAIQNDAERLTFMEEWRQTMLRFLLDVHKHFLQVMYKKFDLATDPWVRRSINDPDDFA
ncbi:DUF115 domain-containing protein [Hahella sp. KA22]|uniref:motility associated factor glycosyltransferase family protein n=1 Tax=Hahella sp. KA22 TaxID=1628392 RepID=UPI000FDD8751|nr:6-hydroxymethylpterin diphosphokinase MptE-like protein [Hahella sp. KA22]AZZ91287.1 DUF115 domain-containing protein [Hahella sp. KA22]QAY54656.1 DUF115 domain-containing protein [Hahella sp. KA22]